MKVQPQALLLCICVILHLLLASPSTADESQEAPEQVIKDAQNPITDRSSVPILNSTGFRIGPFDRTSNVTLIEPVLPISLGKNYLVLRPIVPLVYRPTLDQASGGDFGLGDSTLQMYFVLKPSERVTWGLGLTTLLPTASDSSLGTGKWGLGPAFAAIWMPGRWTIGGRINYYWSIAGDASRADVSLLTIQPVLSYILRDGWYLTSGPIITANMMITDGEKWLLPLGGGIGKVFRLGGQRMNFSLQSYWNALHPETAGEWSLVIQLQSLFPRLRF